MKRMITASVENPKQLPITKLTEDEIRGLPDKLTLVTNMPGVVGEPIFKVVSKEKIAADPDKCFMINSYWGYADGRDVYIASRKYVENYKKDQIAAIEKQLSEYTRYAL